VQESAEADFKGRISELERQGIAVDHLSVAREALAQASADWLGIDATPQQAIEA
jgi:hypothetical protein